MSALNAAAVHVDVLTLLGAARYALGRRTYIVAVIARDVVANAGRLSSDLAQVLVEDIERAIAEGNAGARADVDEWSNAAAALRRAHQRSGATT